MSPGKFLRLVWPESGFYCIAHPFKPRDSDKTVYSHHVFASISDAVAHVLEYKHSRDTYFAVLTLAQEKVWDPNKTDYKTGKKGAWATRLQSNMLAGKAAFFDIDVAKGAGTYASQAEARAALDSFVTNARLPLPTVVSSGGGLHVYWHLEAAITADACRDMQHTMRQLAQALGLMVDPQRTTDVSSVLRVSGTLNWKDRENPRAVDVLQEGVVTPNGAFLGLVRDALIRAGVEPGSAPPRLVANHDPAPTDGMAGNLLKSDFGPPPTIGELAEACPQVQEMLRVQGDLDNSAWYRGFLATVRHVENGAYWCREITKLHPRDNADIDAKLLQLEQFAPARCETIADVMPWGDTPCQGCAFKDKVPNPLAAARRNTPAPAPMLQFAVPGAPPVTVQAPDPPFGYHRPSTGGVERVFKDKDDNETRQQISPYDIYPVRRMVNSGARTEQQEWRAKLPRGVVVDFTLDADALYDSRKFAAAMAHNGLYIEPALLDHVRNYMVAYIKQLQNAYDAENQYTHLGWSDDYNAFVLPSKLLLADGTARTVTLSSGASRATESIHQRGTLQAQIELMRFYDHEAYIPHQVMILGALASTIFYMTGQDGVVVNASGESGASKSTALYAAASMFGAPKLYTINGTNRGATANARNERFATLANLPLLVDEITHMPVRDMQDMVMGVTQPGHRLRLQVDGTEKRGVSSYKAAIMLCTANSSLHNLLSSDGTAGTAGSMRVFEMLFSRPRIHTKADADEFLRGIVENYGHIGDAFVSFVVRHRDAVQAGVRRTMARIDAAGGITPAERYWSACIAVVLVAAEICQALRLLPFSPQRIEAWSLGVQLPLMRGVVHEEYRDPLTVLTDYIAQSQGNILRMRRSGPAGVNTAPGAAVPPGTYFAENAPHGALLGHHDRDLGTLTLLKQGFRDHCQRAGINSWKIIEDLSLLRTTDGGTPRRVIIEKSARRTLGAGTEYARGRSRVFVVDLTHPDIAGVALATVPAGTGAATVTRMAAVR